MKVWDREGREAAQGDSLGREPPAPSDQVQEFICEALEAFRTPVPHSSCSEPPATLSRRGNSLTKRKTSTLTTSLLVLQTFSILLVSKNQAWYLLFLELLKFFNLFICFYLHDRLSTTFCGLFLTI